jgi:hypothetical protein
MNRRSLFAAAALAALALPILSHDFWMEPSSYTLEKGALCSIALKVGDFALGENVPRVDARIVDFSVHGPSTDKKLAGRDGGDPAGYARLESEGLYVLGYRSTATPVEVEATKFESYLRERGLDEALAVREQRSEQANAGRELFSRCAKTIVRVGKGGDGKGFDHVLGYTLELLPEKSPFDLKKVEKDGASLVEGVPLRLMYDGKPLANALVGALSLDAPKPKAGEPNQQPITGRTDAEGRVKLDLPSTGRWLFAAVHIIRVEGNPSADWESFWASLTVEIPGGDAKESKESKEKDSKDSKDKKKS